MKTSVHSPQKTDARTVGKHRRKSTVLGVIEVGGEPNSLALAPLGSEAWVCNTQDCTLSVIDTEALRVSAVLPLPIRPQAIAFDPTGTRAYVTGLGKPLVVVVDVPARRIFGQIAASEGHAIAIDAEGERVYINANSHARGQICVIDAVAGRLLERIDTGPFASAAVLGPDRRLFFCDYLHHELKTMDTATGEITTVLSLPEPFEEFAISPAGDFGYAPYRTADRVVAKIALSSYALVDLLPAPPLPHGFTFSPVGGLACCCSAAVRSVSIIDTRTWQVVSQFQAGEYPQSPVFSADAKRLYLCDSTGNAVWVMALD
jgi:DNA-binding beta-propeller fold protein YncE